jgi:dTDP-4-dehydrorhamnose reductase
MSAGLRVLVTGASGFIGKQFMETFRGDSVTGLRYSRPKLGLVELDLKDPIAVGARMKMLRPEVVIHCAARPSVDWCELHREEACAINLLPVKFLAEKCAHLGARLVFLSTDYVFDGFGGPYSEDDPANPINEYGRLKLEGERAISHLTDRYLIIRTTNVYGFDWESKNFLMANLPRLARGERVRVASDQFGNPTAVKDLCSVVRELITSGCTGTFHVAGPDLVNRAEWLRHAAHTFGLNHRLISGVSTGELDQAAPRPKRSGLVSNRLPPIFARRLTDLRDGLAAMKKEWDQHRGEQAGAAAGSFEGAVNA